MALFTGGTGTAAIGIGFRAVLIAVITGGLQALTVETLSVGAFFSNALQVTAAVVPIGGGTGANRVILRSA